MPHRLNAANYLHFLQEDLLESLDDVPINVRQNMLFMQDGAGPHFALNVRQYLNQCFPQRWIGRGGPIAWPPRSPDITPCDFFLWGYLKTLVYRTPVANINELQNRIFQAAAQITPGMVRNSVRSVQRRVEVCLIDKGVHFEQFL